VPVTGFNFAKVAVSDLAAMERFYCSVFGFVVDRRIVSGSGDHAHEELVLNVPDAPGQTGLLLLTRFVNRALPEPGEWVVGLGVSDIDETVAAAVAAGGTVNMPVQDYAEYGLRVGQVKDPEGHFIQLHEILATPA